MADAPTKSPPVAIGIEPVPSSEAPPQLNVRNLDAAALEGLVSFFYWQATHPEEAAEAAVVALLAAVAFLPEVAAATAVVIPDIVLLAAINFLLSLLLGEFDDSAKKLSALGEKIAPLVTGVSTLESDLANLGKVADRITLKLRQWRCPCPGSSGSKTEPPSRNLLHHHHLRKSHTGKTKTPPRVRVLNYTSQGAVVRQGVGQDGSPEITVTVGRSRGEAHESQPSRTPSTFRGAEIGFERE
jgi:hypothetical protein